MVKASIYSQISTNKRNSYLLFLFFFAIMFALGWLISSVWGLGNIGIVLIGAVSIIWMLISYYKGDSVVLAANGAREVSKRDEPYLVNLVEGLALASGIP
ncbi:MAG: zinc metalloprotease HtpX, partial [Euryarchaeota archaeon HGW-Euryarchaeota-1]